MATRREAEKKKRVLVSAQKMAETSTGRASKAFKLPSGVKKFIISEAGTYEFSIVPYEAGPGNPGADEGEMAVGRTYWVHGGVGPNKDTYCCRAKTFNQPCPICEHRQQLMNQSGRDQDDAERIKKLADSMAPRSRQLWNVLNHKKEADGVQIFDFSQHCFGKHLFAKIERKKEYATFADPEEGMSLSVGAEKKSAGSFSFFDCTDIEFEKREPLSPEVQKAAQCLDKLLICPGYDELKAAHLGGPDEDEPEDDKPTRGRNKDEEEDEPKARRSEPAKAERNGHKDDDDEKEDIKAPAFEVDQQVKHNRFGICTIVHISGDGTSLRLKDEEGEIHRGADPEDCVPIEDDDEPEEEEDDLQPTKGKAPTFELGDKVRHKDHGLCEVVKVRTSGLVLEDEDGEIYPNIEPSDCKPATIKAETNGKAKDDAPKRSSKDVDFDEEEDEPEPTPTRGKARR